MSSTRLLLPILRRSSRFYTTHTHRHSPTHGQKHTHIHTRTGYSGYAVLGLTAIGSLSFYLFGSLYPLPIFELISPRAAPAPLPPDHPDALKYTASLEDALQSLPPLEELRNAPDAEEWYETRPYLKIPEERRVNNLTAGALRGPGRLALPPLVRAKRDESEAVVFVHLGRGLCGHDGIVHGGLLATVLDETLARVAIQNLPEKVGVTATLNVTYKAPTRADQWVMIRINLDSAQGRKAKVSGKVEALDGTTLVEANALFVQPKFAAVLDKTAIQKVMGDPIPPGQKLVLEHGKKHQEEDVKMHPKAL